MRKRLLTLSVLLCWLTACVPIPAPKPLPVSVPPPTPTVTVTFVTTPQPVSGVHYTAGSTQCDSGGDGVAVCSPVLVTAKAVQIVPPSGYTSADVLPLTLVAQQDQTITIVVMSVFPSAPTRAQILDVHLQFQGMTVVTPDHGTLPWFEAAMAWLTPADRHAAYVTKHAAGDTHAIIAVPSAYPLYDEPGQPYDAAHFPMLDWTNGQTKMDPRFRALVEEEIQNGFIPLIFLQEDRTVSMATLPLVIDALQHGADGIDLTRYVMILPGWDGVFYGWEPAHVVIPAWSTLGRQKCPLCVFGIEFNTGHIPLGEGDADYQVGGLMTNFDALFVEFGGIHDDATWQILGRLLGPAYHRPADQPGIDDPTPPYYLRIDTPRGPWKTVCFEFGFDEYSWVRTQINIADIEQHRAYLRSVGCSAIG